MAEPLIPHTEVRTCLSCGKPVKGRSDKKFCDDYCRNNYNNQVKADTNNYVRNINNALRKNRHILEALLGEVGMTKVGKQRLLNEGFQFKYHTHTYTTTKGSTYYFCYEYGFLQLEADLLLIVKKKEI
jgi:predicted nucleic acid-binding Zn ribbon protein